MDFKDKNNEENLFKTKQDTDENYKGNNEEVDDFDYKKIIPQNLHTLYELVGRSIYEEILNEYGGGQIYIQKKECYNRLIQAKQIYFEYIYEGATYNDLRKKYELCETSIRNIIKKFMKENNNKK